MRRSVPEGEQDRIVVMTQNQSDWERYFGVRDDSDPYVLVLNAKGAIVWHGHGQAADLEPMLKQAFIQQ